MTDKVVASVSDPSLDEALEADKQYIEHCRENHPYLYMVSKIIRRVIDIDLF